MSLARSDHLRLPMIESWWQGVGGEGEVSSSLHTEGKEGRKERRAGPACLRVETRTERES